MFGLLPDGNVDFAKLYRASKMFET